MDDDLRDLTRASDANTSRLLAQAQADDIPATERLMDCLQIPPELRERLAYSLDRMDGVAFQALLTAVEALRERAEKR